MEPVASALEALELVVAGGRVIDPQSGLDDVRHLGIRDGTVVAVSETPLTGTTVVDAEGLVVAPGFIDLHAHGQDPTSSRYQAMDGVTTALELEIGAFPIDRWYARRGGASLINYGASASHQAARIRALGSVFARGNPDGTFSLGESDDDTLYRAASEEELAGLRQLMVRGLRDGGIGLGFGLSYTPGVSHRELLQMFQVAAEYEAPAFIHLRSSAAFERGGALAPFQEVIANAAVTGAPLHIVHMNSTSGARAEEALAMIRGARERGIDVTTEAYPYTASASLIESPLFDGWDGRPREAYRTLQWVGTGERLTPETFALYRRQGGWVIMHGRSEETNEWIVGQPDVIAASDGIPFSEGRAHPRGAGTFARILGHYARDRGALSLMDALRKMTLLPARAARVHRARDGPQGPRAGRQRRRPDDLRPGPHHRPRHLRRAGPVLRRHRARARRGHVRRPRRCAGRGRAARPSAPRPTPGAGIAAGRFVGAPVAGRRASDADAVGRSPASP